MSKRKGSKNIYPFSIFDPWDNPLCTCPIKYSLNPYTGCSFKCLYCYAVSYIGLIDSKPKKDYRRKLLSALLKLDKKLPINIGTSSDPYPPIEEKYMDTRFTLRVLGANGFKIILTTKGGRLLARDVDVLSKINAAVTPTITTLDGSLARILEPNAPSPKERLRGIEELLKHDVPVGVRIDPIIPGLNDDDFSIKNLVDTVASLGVRFIVTSTYKARFLDFRRMTNAFPELERYWRQIYFEEGEKMYGYYYLSLSRRKKILGKVISAAREKGIEYATCREGLVTKDFFNAKSCDGTHLIPQRIKSSFNNLILGDD